VRGLFREYSVLWQHKYESPMTVSKVIYTLTGGLLNFEALGLSGTQIYQCYYYVSYFYVIRDLKPGPGV
jgi:hypothetical protein